MKITVIGVLATALLLAGIATWASWHPGSSRSRLLELPANACSVWPVREVTAEVRGATINSAHPFYRPLGTVANHKYLSALCNYDDDPGWRFGQVVPSPNISLEIDQISSLRALNLLGSPPVITIATGDAVTGLLWQCVSTASGLDLQVTSDPGITVDPIAAKGDLLRICSRL